MTKWIYKVSATIKTQHAYTIAFFQIPDSQKPTKLY